MTGPGAGRAGAHGSLVRPRSAGQPLRAPEGQAPTVPKEARPVGR
ncbi:hypothetical protein JOF58_006294 [Streptomyces cinnamonensis]|nr:hypothetical protein [Streptomyces virginiae]